MKTAVFEKQATRFDMCGQRLSVDLNLGSEGVSQGLAKRLFDYAAKSLRDDGFGFMVDLAIAGKWEASVYTIDGDMPSADRSYCVRITNPEGGYVEMIGIYTSKGWPSIDHGYAMNR